MTDMDAKALDEKGLKAAYKELNDPSVVVRSPKSVMQSCIRAYLSASTGAGDPICSKCASQEHGSPKLPTECTCGQYPAKSDAVEALETLLMEPVRIEPDIYEPEDAYGDGYCEGFWDAKARYELAIRNRIRAALSEKAAPSTGTEKRNG